MIRKLGVKSLKTMNRRANDNESCVDKWYKLWVEKVFIKKKKKEYEMGR